MGYNVETITISVRLDNHLDERTERDKLQFEFLKREIKELCEDPNLDIGIDAMGLDPA